MYMSQKPDPCVINITPPPIHSIHYNFWYTEILLNSELTMVKFSNSLRTSCVVSITTATT